MSDIKVNSEVVWNGDNAKVLFDNAQKKALTESAILVQGAAVKNAPKDTGSLKASITRQVSKFNATIGTNLIYAAIHEFGGTIKAINGKYLKFKSRKTGSWVQVEKVTIKATPYLIPALLLNKGKILNIFKKANKAVKYVD